MKMTNGLSEEGRMVCKYFLEGVIKKKKNDALGFQNLSESWINYS